MNLGGTKKRRKRMKKQRGSGMKITRRKRRRRQRGRGFFTDLLKTGAKHALTAAAITGLDVLENKRSLKDAVKTHGVRALKNTSGMVKQRMNLGELPANSKNEGFPKRHQAINGSKKISLLDRLHLDLFQQDRFLPNGVDVRLRFNRARPTFYMMTKGGSTGKVKILSMILWVRKVKPTPVMMNAINQSLNTHRAKYPLRRVEVKTFTIATGSQSKITDHLFQGQMPKRLILGFMENAAFNGDQTKNPFHFQNFGIKKLDVSINGETISTRCFEPNFNDNLYLRSYLSLYQALGKLGEDWAPDITLEEYKSGYTLWGWDFTEDQEAQSDEFHIIETGNLRVEVQFTNNTATTINCVVYAEFDNLLEINKQ
ncbi:uncharacterized protein F54H12.2-like [Saccostrea cucullata]|uniref:uncharacterized protein F54H12.2-like n=1 Tax=Saccostrea cuccullata TaxID=36930 RepID=UPI002ED2B305